MPQHTMGTLPTRNYNEGQFEGAEAISGERMYDTILKDRDTCYACVVRCKRVVEIKDGRYTVDPYYGGPEYETLSTFGSYCGVDDLAAIARANQICNMYGVDTISCGATIAFAMECYEKGIIGKEETGGIDLRFGNAEAMLQALEQIVRNEGPLGTRALTGFGARRPDLGPGRRGVPDHGQESGSPRPHAPGQTLPRPDLRGQPLRRRPSIQRTRLDD
jgi:aldehyde:ferredoxin oxidoreductase